MTEGERGKTEGHKQIMVTLGNVVLDWHYIGTGTGQDTHTKILFLELSLVFCWHRCQTGEHKKIMITQDTHTKIIMPVSELSLLLAQVPDRRT